MNDPATADATSRGPGGIIYDVGVWAMLAETDDVLSGLAVVRDKLYEVSMSLIDFRDNYERAHLEDNPPTADEATVERFLDELQPNVDDISSWVAGQSVRLRNAKHELMGAQAWAATPDAE